MSESEWVWHISCGYNTLQEVEMFKFTLFGTTDENTKKTVQELLSITQAKREIAHSKAVR